MILKKNSLRLKLAFTIMWVNIAYLMITFSLEYLNRSFLYNYGSPGNYAGFILLVFSTKVLPLTLVYLLILFFLMSPLQEAVNRLNAGLTLGDKLKEKTRKSILMMPRVLLVANISGYIIGVILRLYTEYGYSGLDSVEGWFQVCYGFTIGATLSLTQISINNLILVEPKKLLKLHNLEVKKDREGVFGIRIFWVGFFLVVYTFFFIYDISKFAFDSETKYTGTLESVIQQEKTSLEARTSHIDEMARMLNIQENIEEKAKINYPLGNESKEDKERERSIIFILALLVVLSVDIATIYFAVKDLLTQVVNVKMTMTDIITGEGDFTKRIIITENDAIGRIIAILNRFMEKFRILLLKIADSTKSVATQKDAMENTLNNFLGATETMVGFIGDVYSQTSNQTDVINETKEKLLTMLTNSNSISGNIDNLVNFVEQTSTAMVEMGASINSVAQITREVGKTSGQLMEAADIGKENVRATIDSIKTIEKSSEQIEEILSLISDLATRTNMLSMNASIEAAHAGDAGKGFAVVADEIRHLAEESAESAGDISIIIEGISNQISDGVGLAEKTGISLNEIYKYTDETTNMITSISNSMEEQNRAVKDIISTVTSVINATLETKQLTDEQKGQSESIKSAMEELIRVSDIIHQNARKQEERSKQVKEIVFNVQSVMTKNTEQVKHLEDELKSFKLE